MKIYFCDECNESIPLSDINSNKITIDQGKIFCNDCAPAPKPTARSGLNAPTIGLGMLLCLAMGMGIMAVWGDTILRRGDRESAASKIERLEGEIAGLKSSHGDRLAAVEGDFAETSGADGEVGKYARATRAISQNASALSQIRHSITRLDDELKSELKKHGQAIDDLKNRFETDVSRLDKAFGENVVSDLQKINTDLDALRDHHRLLDQRMSYVEEIGSEILKAGPRTAKKAEPAGAKKGGDTALSEALQKQLDQVLLELGSKEPAKRFAAASWFSELEPQIRNRKAEEALVATFEDKADYVVTAALDSLAGMEAHWTIPNIIELLKHDNVFIREKAVDSLNKLMGRDIKVDPEADRGVILSRIRELQAWWRENKATLVGGA